MLANSPSIFLQLSKVKPGYKCYRWVRPHVTLCVPPIPRVFLLATPWIITWGVPQFRLRCLLNYCLADFLDGALLFCQRRRRRRKRWHSRVTAFGSPRWPVAEVTNLSVRLRWHLPLASPLIQLAWRSQGRLGAEDGKKVAVLSRYADNCTHKSRNLRVFKRVRLFLFYAFTDRRTHSHALSHTPPCWCELKAKYIAVAVILVVLLSDKWGASCVCRNILMADNKWGVSTCGLWQRTLMYIYAQSTFGQILSELRDFKKS